VHFRCAHVLYLDQIKESHGLPRDIALDNGPEMTSKAMLFLESTGKGTIAFHSALQAKTDCIREDIQLSLP
jgi:hypothetical protein